MEGKQLDLDAPLLSLRRIAAATAGDDAVPPLPPRRSVLPFYNSDLKSGPVGNPAVVPFVWEKAPGQPKISSFAETAVDWNWTPPKLPPGRSLKDKGADLVNGASFISQSKSIVQNPAPITCSSAGCSEKSKMEDEDEVNSTDGGEEYAFSDARDAFSCNESFSAKCSMSVGTGSRDPLRGFLKDQQTKEFMMDRFLPAAHAMAADCPQRIGWKPPRPPVEDSGETESMTTQRRRLPLDYQYQLRTGQLHVKDEEDADQEDYADEHGTYPGVGIFSSKACGLVPRFCLKSTFGLLPAPGRKLQGRHMPRTDSKSNPHIKVLHHSSMGKNKEEDSWEAVYRYKLNYGYHPQKGSGSKLMSESNQLTSCSDSQILECSSFLNSTSSTLSFDELENTEKEKCTWKTGIISCEKDFRSCRETVCSHGKLQGFDWTSPAAEGTFNCVSDFREVPNPKFNSAGISADAKAMRNSTGDSSTGEGESQREKESVVSETSNGDELQLKSSTSVEPSFSSHHGKSDFAGIGGSALINNEKGDFRLVLKVEPEKDDKSSALYLLPPPPPKSPSESWLERTLPSISSKRSQQRSILGIQLHPKNHASQASIRYHKLDIENRTSNMRPRRTRFAEDAKAT